MLAALKQQLNQVIFLFMIKKKPELLALAFLVLENVFNTYAFLI